MRRRLTAATAQAIRIGILSRRVPFTVTSYPEGGWSTVIDSARWEADTEAYRRMSGLRAALAARARQRTKRFAAIVRCQSAPRSPGMW